MGLKQNINSHMLVMVYVPRQLQGIAHLSGKQRIAVLILLVWKGGKLTDQDMCIASHCIFCTHVTRDGFAALKEQ